MMEFYTYMVVVHLAVSLILSAAAEKDEALVCSVCRAVVDEVSWEISKVDPKKTIQVGSFRVDSRGDQARYEIPYARSETHLTELFESVCTHMTNYAETTDSAGRKSLIRTSSRDGKGVKLNSISINPESQRLFKSTCETLIEDHEEDMVKIFNRNDLPQSIAEKKVCVELSGLCTKKLLEVPMPDPSSEEFEEEEDGADSDTPSEGTEPKEDKPFGVDFDLDKMMAESQKKVADPTKESTNSGGTDSEAGTADEKEEL